MLKRNKLRSLSFLIKAETMNYPIAGLIVIVAIAIVFWLIKRNQKDEKDLEQELNKTEIHPGTDDEPKV